MFSRLNPKRLFKSSSSSSSSSSRKTLYPHPISPSNIRILTVLPGPWESPIECRLQETVLQDAEPYKALSYTWKSREDDTSVGQILCNKFSINISTNLFLALRQLRQENGVLKIWVDSICINQNDIDERTSQVGIMREIYARSTEVIIWLGEAGHSDHLGHSLEALLAKTDSEDLYRWYGDERDLPKLRAFRAKAKIAGGPVMKQSEAEIADVFGALYVLHALINGVEASNIEELRHLSKTGPILKGFDALMEHRWWSRVWVVQEVVVAQSATLRYGKLSVPWKLLTQAATQFEKGRLEAHADSAYTYLNEQSLARFSANVLEIETTRDAWNFLQPVGLLQLLRKFRSRSASDERDKVFALLGLVRYWRLREWRISPDYRLSTKEVLLSTTKSLLASVGSLSVLAGTLRYRNARDTSPSWVIDWDDPPPWNEDTRLNNTLSYNAGGTMGLIELHKESVLKVEGSCLDEIVSIGEELVETTIARMRLVVDAWFELYTSLRTPRSPWISPPLNRISQSSDAFWQTICGNLKYHQIDRKQNTKMGFSEATLDIALAFEQFRFADINYRRNTSIIDGLWHESEERPEFKWVNAFRHAVACASQGRRFFITKNGYIGIGPRDIVKGDQVFVLRSSPVSLVFRQTAGSITCQGNKVEVLLSPTYQDPIKAGRGASLPDTRQRVCEAVHAQLFTIVGDAYVHGIMNGEFLQPGSRNYRQPESVYLV